MSIETSLYQAATNLIESRYPIGWGGAAAIGLNDGHILTSVAPDTDFDALSLCMEVGSYLEAHKLNKEVTHSLCVFRDNEKSPFKILSPCGICQERLRFWGPDVKVAITNPKNAPLFVRLSELQTHHWSTAYL